MLVQVASNIKREIDRVFTRCEGAFAERTLKGYRVDLSVFVEWCADRGETEYPVSSDLVAAFVASESERVRPSTLKRRLAAIRFVHVYGDHPDPTKASEVRLAMRRALMRKPRRPEQASGLTFDHLTAIRAACSDTREGLRDAALISVGYDTLCRSCELVSLEVSDLDLEAGSVLIRRAKNDQAGDGRIAWLSPDTVRLVRRWLEVSHVTEGPVFRSLHHGVVGRATMDDRSIRRLVKRAAQRAGLETDAVRLSGHSMRVGGAQDMLAAGFDALAIMQAGGWRTPNVVLRYVEHAETRALHQDRWMRLSSG